VASLQQTACVSLQQRVCIRYRLSVPVVCRWKDENGSRCLAKGYTRDISTHGVFVFSSELPPMGATVRLEFSFPPLEESSEGLRLRSLGEVVRIETNGQGTGFALVSEFTRFER
jgi:hypothetical protein